MLSWSMHLSRNKLPCSCVLSHRQRGCQPTYLSWQNLSSLIHLRMRAIDTRKYATGRLFRFILNIFSLIAKLLSWAIFKKRVSSAHLKLKWTCVRGKMGAFRLWKRYFLKQRRGQNYHLTHNACRKCGGKKIKYVHFGLLTAFLRNYISFVWTAYIFWLNCILQPWTYSSTKPQVRVLRRRMGCDTLTFHW